MSRQFKYQLLGENDEDPGYEVLALCREEEHYFLDPQPAARERYELLGCAPEGRLREAVAQARKGGSAPVGLLITLPLDRHGEPTADPFDAWYLGNVRVLDVRPSARDLSLLDIAVEGLLECWDAGDEAQSDIPEKPPLSPGFRLIDRDDELWGTCREVALVGEKQPGLEDAPLRLLGCEPLSGRGPAGAPLDDLRRNPRLLRRGEGQRRPRLILRNPWTAAPSASTAVPATTEETGRANASTAHPASPRTARVRPEPSVHAEALAIA